MTENRYASIHLQVDLEMPSAWDLDEILVKGGLATLTQETMWVVAYDSVMQVRTVVEVARGGYHSMEVPIPAILSAVLTAGTDRFVIAHNHSTNDVTPTAADMDLTRKVMAASNTCGLFFEDHVIVGSDGGRFSMAEQGILVPSQKLTALAKTGRKAAT